MSRLAVSAFTRPQPGINMGKDSFQIAGFDVRKLAALYCRNGGCLSARFVSPTLRKKGFEPRVIPAIYVKPFYTGQIVGSDYTGQSEVAWKTIQ